MYYGFSRNCILGRVEIDLDIKEEITELVVNAHAFTDLSVLHLIKLGNIQGIMDKLFGCKNSPISSRFKAYLITCFN